ncbi:hypothetical protein GCM10022254_14630 [Actinomadura meridiana]|uniref:DUF397 domain-containing protein n=1 Tax=Actinomadura meridiana TaxID=559626 RepID=A0ABP8BV68_9ACTN
MSMPPTQYTTWRKSSYSTQDPTECVELGVRADGQGFGARDSTDPVGPMLAFTKAEWRVFLDEVKRGTHDLA